MEVFGKCRGQGHDVSSRDACRSHKRDVVLFTGGPMAHASQRGAFQTAAL
ncbi:hypothetical protein SJ05684_b51930 (plasmid) [Sinorhizobium sojae CCBAU 05684]|uniref:Uncharacterized protein n=1 Tax=Sinorhizobium sojae CCBAU 05684 TaxID=716928 RepID=A0A249PKD1_9HYPH|nr:hypothetical protein SJ05684_b51930 [Sinorhizobium sojae CCBAU 05684]